MRWIVFGSVGLLAMLAPLAAGAAPPAPPLLVAVDPLSQPAPALERPLRLGQRDERPAEEKLVRALWSKKVAAAPGERLRVAVLLHEPAIDDLVEPEDGAEAVEALRVRHLAALERAFAGAASERGFVPLRGLSHLPVVFGEVPADRLLAVAALAEVAAIQDDHPVRKADIEGNALIGATRARDELGAQGAGVGVAILDTGVDLGHSEFAGRIVTNANTFTRGASGDDNNGHGTAVAGIAAGATLGVAPRANVWAIKVLNSSGDGSATSTEEGLDLVYANRNQFGGLRVVNMSIVYSGPFNRDCDGEFPIDAALVNQLYAAGVVITAAGGNEGRKDGITWPGCLSKVISVGAVYDADLGTQRGGCTDDDVHADTIACWSSNGVPLDVFAPSYSARAAGRGGGFGDGFGGTSAAAPYAAGAAALILGLRPQTTPGELQNAFMTTGRPLTDRNGLTRNRIDVVEAYASLAPAEPPPPPGGEGSCARNATTACLAAGRFEVTVTYTGAGGGVAKVMTFGTERADNGETAMFGFGSPSRYDIAVTVLDSCAANKRFTVLLSGQSSLAWSAQVRDTVTDKVKTYRNPANRLTRTTLDKVTFRCP